jgi:Ser/Thr protein kinase RdoA (MazF antagonist)
MNMSMDFIKNSIIDKFDFLGEFVSVDTQKSGLINGTFTLTYALPGGANCKYILQKINTAIFTEPVALMENIDKVTKHIRTVSAKNGKDPKKSTLNIIKTKNGNLFYVDEEGSYWRAYDFIEGCVTYNKVNKPEDFYKAGVALGEFQKSLDDYPADELVETIKNFHNTPSRYNDLCKAVEEDRAGRGISVQKEIEFFDSRKDFFSIITDGIADGTIPVRVTHNDTKFNNIMLDEKTGDVACFIDLDTVMPGSALYDFGDSIRSGANLASEDEKNPEDVKFSVELFAIYVKGYLSCMKDFLTPTEIRLLPESAILITLELAMRFLTDYLNGDTYFKTTRPGQNLDRARCQMKLADDMEKNIEKMRKLVELAL